MRAPRSFPPSAAVPDDYWRTPPAIVAQLHQLTRDGIRLDPFPSPARLEDLVGAEIRMRNSLRSRQSWREAAGHGLAYANPPYSQPKLGRCMQKMFAEAMDGLWLTALVPASTDVGWFHDAFCTYADQILLRRGRVRYIKQNGSAKGTPFYPSALFHFAGRRNRRSRMERFQRIFGKSGIVLPCGADILPLLAECAPMRAVRPPQRAPRATGKGRHRKGSLGLENGRFETPAGAA